MGSQHLNLKWRNHHSNLLSVFAQLLTSESFTDVTLVCDGASIRAHKIILSACSPFFHNIFSQHPCQHPIIILKDVAYKDLKVLIDFMYSGEVNIAQEYLPAFLQIAESLKIKGLSENESSTSCSSSVKRSMQSDGRSSVLAKCKRRRSSKNLSDEKSEDESVDMQDTIRKENVSRDMNVLNCSPSDMAHPGVTDRYSSPMQRYEQAYNWGVSTESSEFVEVNLHDEDTNNTGQSVNQDDSTTDIVGADNTCPQENKHLHLREDTSSDIESLRQLQRVTGLMSTVTTNYSGSPNNKNDYSSPSVTEECDVETGQSEKAIDVAPPVETGHVLTRLPRHKKKDCIVCGNRQAGQRRRSRQWCPGCNVGVHVHCFAKLEHYRRSNKRTARVEEVTICARSPEIIKIKSEPFNEANTESNIESDAESSAQTELETIKIGLQLVKFLLNEDHLKHLRKAIPSSRPQAVHQRFENKMFPISNEVIGRCTCIDPQKFVNDLLTELYTEEYLASHSITGQRWRNKDGTPKDGMNPLELDHIIRCVQSVFYTKQLSDAEVKSFIRIKLGNASKLYARRKQLANANLLRISQ